MTTLPTGWTSLVSIQTPPSAPLFSRSLSSRTLFTTEWVSTQLSRHRCLSSLPFPPLFLSSIQREMSHFCIFLSMRPFKVNYVFLFFCCDYEYICMYVYLWRSVLTFQQNYLSFSTIHLSSPALPPPLPPAPDSDPRRMTGPPHIPIGSASFVFENT